MDKILIEYHGTGEPDHLQYSISTSPVDDGIVFIKGIPCQAPDVYALVSLQCEMCGKMAGVLGKTEEAVLERPQSVLSTFS